MAIGAFSLTNCTGARNVAIGYFTAVANTSGADNVYIGQGAGRFQQTGSNNTMLGQGAGYGAAAYSASGNVLIGRYAGYNETNSNRLYIANSNTTTPLIYGLFTGAGAGLIIHSQNAAGIPLTVKGIAAQASNLQNWEDSVGTALLEVEATGVHDYRWAMGNSTKDPTADAPDDWIEVKIGGAVFYAPVYQA